MRTESIPPAAGHHKLDDGTVVKKATCTEMGQRVYKCVECGKELKTENIAKLAHVSDEGTVTKEATCDAQGEMEYRCTICGEVVRKTTIPRVRTHTMGEGVITREPTCQSSGVKEYYCTECGDCIKTEYLDRLSHIPDEGTVTKEPTCKTYGLKEYKCILCENRVSTEIIEPLGHTLDEGVVEKEPACAVNGRKVFSCERCGLRMKSEAIDALGHISDEGTVTKEPECAKQGTKEYCCTRCGTVVRRESIPATGEHVFEDRVTKEPTCIERGELLHECKVCGLQRRESLERAPHKLEHVDYLAPTCTEKGHMEHFRCSVCNGHLVEETKKYVRPDGVDEVKQLVSKVVELNPLGHALVYHEAVPATCKKDGNAEYYTCERCDAVLDISKNEVSMADITEPKHPHNLVHIAAKSAKVKVSGNIEYWKCSECKSLFLDKNGKKPTTKAAVTIAALPRIDIAEGSFWLEDMVWTGSAVIPDDEVICHGVVLSRGSDYTVTFSNNKNPGTGYALFKGIGDYTGSVKVGFVIAKPELRYRAYVQKKGWMNWTTAGIGQNTNSTRFAGTTDNLRMETIQMQLSGVEGDVKYRAYVEKLGWTQWARTSDKTSYAGTKGQAKRVEMIQLQASGQVDRLYDMYYRTYCEKFGWLGWAKSGEKSGSAGYGRKLTAFQVQFVQACEGFDRGDKKSFYDKSKDGANPK